MKKWFPFFSVSILAGFLALGVSAQVPPHDQDQYDEAVSELLPATPGQIDDYQDRLEETRTATHDRDPLRILNRSDIISLDPGGDPPRVRISPGIATVVVFTDATGQPWPVAGYVIGDQEGFDVIQLGSGEEGESSANITVSPTRVAGWTNIIVRLVGEERPVIITLEIDLDEVHYRYDLQILREGPNARPAIGHRTMEVSRPGNRHMLAFIDGVDLPSTAEELMVAGVPGTRAWKDGDGMWVRTPWTLLSPDFDEVMELSGIRVYRLAAMPTLLFFVNGRTLAAEVVLP
ncbi:MAG: hypothetical protein OXH65_02985 [Paracoccaceae bacterium]|nr:hypothetical protein [Paracoccaceae bacterium]